MKFLAATVVACAALVLSGCQGGVLVDLGAGVEESAPADIADYAAQGLTWGECDPEWLMESTPTNHGFECASLDVPALYDASAVDVPDFRIAMMRRTPESGESLGTIFINPGGPGVSGMDQLQWSPFPEEMVDNFTIIGFDPRGVGQSDFADGSEIHCSDELDLASYFEESSPGSEAELDEVAAVIDEFYQDCSSRNPYWWTLSTDNVVRDLDIMREVVTPGEPLNFIGSSYGTTIAGRYVSVFPETVGKIVFDSPTTVDTDRIQSALEGLAADEQKLRIYVQGYADNQGLTFEEAWDDVMEVKQLADDDQLYGFAGVVPVPEYEGVFISSEYLLWRGILALNYQPEDQAIQVFTEGIYYALNPDYRWMGTFEYFALDLDGYDAEVLYSTSAGQREIVRDNSFEVMGIVNTMDYAPEPLSIDEQKELSRRSAEVAPLLDELYSDASGYEYFGEPKSMSWEDIARDDPAIPDPPTEPFVPSNPSGTPLLIVGSTNESVTPFQFAKDTADLLGSPLIAVEGSNHAPVAYYDNDCVNRILMDYLLDRADIVSVTCPAP